MTRSRFGAALLVFAVEVLVPGCGGDEAANGDAAGSSGGPEVERPAGAGGADGLAGAGGEAAVAAGGTGSGGGGDVDPCGPPDLSIPYPYAISGFWVFARSSACEWRSVVQRIHRLGGDTLLQFGSRLTSRSVNGAGQLLKDGAPDPAFTSCTEGNATCYQAALAALKAENPASTVARVLALDTREAFGGALLRCPAIEKQIVVGDDVYHRLIVRSNDAESASCDFTGGGAYDVIVVHGKTSDSVGLMLEQADLFGMHAYLGMPVAAGDPGGAWNVDQALVPSLLEVTRRTLSDWKQRHGAHPSFAGVYQSFEIALNDPPVSSVLSLYGQQHAIVRSILPARSIVVSPYWNARKAKSGQSAADVKAAFKAVAKSNVDVIAPQDGRGTGNVGLFWDYQAGDVVDSELVPVVGNVTYGAAYTEQTTDFYRAAKETRDELASAGGVDVALWANLEAFEPSPGVACGPFTSRHRTSKRRLDQAVMFAGGHASKLISYMWDGFYTCAGGLATTLADDIEADHARPIITQAFPFQSNGKDGVIVRGYHVANMSTVTLSFYDAAWSLQAEDVVVQGSGWTNPDFGQNLSDVPDGVEELFVPFGWNDVVPDFWLHLKVTSNGKPTTHNYSLAY